MNNILPDEDMQQYYHLFAMQMGPEMEQRIQTEVEKRYHSIFAEQAEKLQTEKDKNQLLSKRLDISLAQCKELHRQVEELYNSILAEQQAAANGCIIS